MPHEALWVEELLAEPAAAFGDRAMRECKDDLAEQKRLMHQVAPGAMTLLSQKIAWP